MGRNKGPDLAKVGADSTHTVEWLTEHVRNPKAHKPDSRMPSFGDKINPEDLRSLAEYLASLK
jgi:cbb3-type cytochrome oxidase cytochrome c subunit